MSTTVLTLLGFLSTTIYYLSLIVAAIFVITKGKHDLHMLQQNSYRITRYVKWLRNNFFDKQRYIELAVIAAMIICYFFKLPLLINLIGLAVYPIITFKLLTQKHKKALIFTARAKRIYLGFLILVAALWITVFSLSNVLLHYLILTVIAMVSYKIIIAANLLLHPVEKLIQRWYLREAKKILTQNPNLIVIGITGSYGKTSVKHFLHRILSEKYNTLMTPGSVNTPMGIVRIIREELNPTHQVFIVEMGAKQLGDIRELCDIVKPKIGILTAVGEQHLETFKSIENIQKTKFELVDAIPAESFVVLNADYEYIANKPVNNTTAVYYASTPQKGASYWLNNIVYNQQGTLFDIECLNSTTISCSTKLLGQHNLTNLLAAVAVAQRLGISESDINHAIQTMQPVEHRMQIKSTPSGITIIDDAFNSNPVGAEMALQTLNQIQGNRKIVVTPGFIELGPMQMFYNEQLGAQIAKYCDYAILVGPKVTKAIATGLVNANFDNYFVANNLTDANNFLHSNLQVKSGDVVLYENDLPDAYEKL